MTISGAFEGTRRISVRKEEIIYVRSPSGRRRRKQFVRIGGWKMMRVISVFFSVVKGERELLLRKRKIGVCSLYMLKMGTNGFCWKRSENTSGSRTVMHVGQTFNFVYVSMVDGMFYEVYYR